MERSIAANARRGARQADVAVALGLLLPAVQKIRGTVESLKKKPAKTADGCIRALTLSGQLPAVQDVEEARARLKARLEGVGDEIFERLRDLVPPEPLLYVEQRK